jgi:hypothetical protein
MILDDSPLLRQLGIESKDIRPLILSPVEFREQGQV